MHLNRSSGLFLLGIAFALTGCPETECLTGECASGDDDAVVATPTPAPFSAQLKIVAPYSWMGTFYAFPYDGRPSDPNCEEVNECVVNLEKEGTLQVAITGETFLCVNQFTTIGQTNNGQIVELKDEWLEEGQCGLAPEGDYSGNNVHTDLVSDQVVIDLGFPVDGIVTGDKFYNETSDGKLEGTVSADLSEIWYHLVAYESGNEWEATIKLL
ncbi:hypothetical protein HYV70_01415 [Candidatus Uhrbacteria bacterium]|nr:hypothetical protein [Candidatus Uhrbacteria bacterium]